MISMRKYHQRGKAAIHFMSGWEDMEGLCLLGFISHMAGMIAGD